jgi:hypothetical protein
MLTDRSFVLAVSDDPVELFALREELAGRLPEPFADDDDALLVALLMVRQAQTWRGATGPVRLRTSSLGQVVHFEVLRDVDEDADSGPVSIDAFHGLLETLADRADRFAVSTFPGTVSLAAQRMAAPVTFSFEPEIDLRVAA